jgi:hypothetical protein
VLGEEISEIVVHRDVVHGYVLSLDVVVYESVFDGDVFQSLGPGEDGLVHNRDGGLIVVENLDGPLNLKAECR